MLFIMHFSGTFAFSHWRSQTQMNENWVRMEALMKLQQISDYDLKYPSGIII